MGVESRGKQLAGTGGNGAREWAEPEDLYWPLRRIIDRINGHDLLECGHTLPANSAYDQDSGLKDGRRCPVCHASSARDPQAEIRAHLEFLDRFSGRNRPPNR